MRICRTYRIFDASELPLNVYSNVIEDQKGEEKIARIDESEIMAQ